MSTLITAQTTLQTVLQPAPVLHTVLTVGQGPQGAPGATAGDKHYQHTQGTPQAVWSITHNLNKRPSVTAFDSSGAQVEGDVTYTDANTLTLEFSGAFSGVAYLN